MGIVDAGIVHRHRKKSRRSQRLDSGIGLFQMPPDRLFALIDAEDRLRRHPPRPIDAALAAVALQRQQDLPGVPLFIGEVKHQAPFPIAEVFDGLENVLEFARRQGR